MRNFISCIIFIILTITLLLYSHAYADVYVVVNPDNTIHTIEEKPDEVLVYGMRRYPIQAWPEFHPKNYMWSDTGLRIKNSNEQQIDLDIELEKRSEDNRSEKISAQIVLMAISELELSDTGENYSSERLKHEKIINDRKDGE